MCERGSGESSVNIIHTRSGSRAGEGSSPWRWGNVLHAASRESLAPAGRSVGRSKAVKRQNRQVHEKKLASLIL